jgi:hypothetical protein
MSGQSAIEALRQGRCWNQPILLPSAMGLGARIDAQAKGALWGNPQKVVEASISAARYLGADAVWISALGADGGPDLDPAACRDAVTRAIAAAARLRIGCVAEIRGPLARAVARGDIFEHALAAIKPDLIAEFEALAKLRPDIIVLSEPAATLEQAASRGLARLYGSLKRLAEHYDILKGMRPALPEMIGAVAPDLAFSTGLATTAGRRALVVAPLWDDPAAFSAEVDRAIAEAQQKGLPLIVSSAGSLDRDLDPHLCRQAAAHITERV